MATSNHCRPSAALEASDTVSSNLEPQPPVSHRRKISLPWFRQSSFGIGTKSATLKKQHTIAASTYDPFDVRLKNS